MMMMTENVDIRSILAHHVAVTIANPVKTIQTTVPSGGLGHSQATSKNYSSTSTYTYNSQ